MLTDPITLWAFAVLVILALILMLVGINVLYQIKIYYLLNESGSPYTTAPLEAAEQAV